jgi:TatD DNase family protein
MKRGENEFMKKQVVLTDTHAHLDMLGSDDQIAGAIERARENGVARIITVADKLASSYRAIEIAEKFDGVYATVGVHPHDSESVNKDTLKELERLALHPKVVAIGEIGLDYYKNYAPQAIQQKVFEEQLDLAVYLDLPVIIHDRDADVDVMKAIIKHRPKKGLFHCFSSSVEFAEQVLAMNYYISLAGPVTFKNADSLMDVAKYIPLTKLLLETDTPYLTPQPHRGQDNEPAYVRFIAEKISEIKGVSLGTVSASTEENASILFGI